MNKYLLRKSEFLSSDILQNNFVKCFAPIHVTQYILGSSRATVQFNFVSPTTVGQRIYTIIWVLAVTASLYLFVEKYFHDLYYEKNITLYITYSVGISVQYISYILNILHVRFLRQEDIVRLYIKLQKIDHILNLTNIQNLNIVLEYINIFFVVLISSSFTLGYIIYIKCDSIKPNFTLCIFLAILTTYLELLIMASFIYYLGVRVKFLNTVIRHHVNRTNDGVKNNIEYFITFLTTLRLPKDYDYQQVEMESVSTCLKLVVRIFKFVSDLYSFQVFLIITTFFIWTFLVLVAIFVGITSKLVSAHAAVLLVQWVVFYFSQVATLSLVSDWFVDQLNSTKSLCVKILTGNYRESVIQVADKMISVLNTEEPKFSVYGIFILNKGLSLQLVGLIANYVIILIQFNLV